MNASSLSLNEQPTIKMAEENRNIIVARGCISHWYARTVGLAVDDLYTRLQFEAKYVGLAAIGH